MSCDCNKVDSEGCAPMPAVDRGVRAIVRGADGCPAELTGTGVLAQGPGGAYIADGSANKSACLPNIMASSSPPALMGLTVPEGCYRQFTGNGSADAGKVVKWDGSAFVLRSLLESLCYPSSVVQTTCCPSHGLAVWNQTGSSICLQQWNPCDDITSKPVSNPKFVACEGGTMVTFTFCEVPELVAGTEYRTLVCTDDGPRVLGASTGDVATRQFIPFDLLGSGSPLIYPDSNSYSQSGGSTFQDTIDLAAKTGVAIPVGATHVQLIFNLTLLNNQDSRTLLARLYVPGSVSAANQRAYVVGARGGTGTFASNVFGTVNCSITVPILNGGVSWLVDTDGTSNLWNALLMCRCEGYWVG